MRLLSEISTKLAVNVSQPRLVAKIGAEYFPLPKTNLGKINIALPKNRNESLGAVSKCFNNHF